jgi:TonB-dependent SusC/RagA subfamily outer membrane receptor
VEGIEYSSAEFEKLNLDPGRIESITVLKDESAIKLYGQRGREGVIIVVLKKEITKPEPIPNPNELNGAINNSEDPIRHIDGSTYIYAGSSNGTTPEIVNTIIVKGKIYTADQANQLFTKNQFSGLVIMTPEHTYKMHGIKVPAIVLVSDYTEFSKYSSDTSPLK